MALELAKVSGTIMDGVSVGTASTTWATALDGGSGERFDNVVFQVSVTFNASATGDALIHIRKSADGGTTDSNLSTEMMTIDCETSAPQILTVEAIGFDYLEIGIENEDASYALTGTVKYEGLKLTGLS